MNWMRLCVPCTVAGEGPGELGLAGAGEVLEQQVALGEQAGQREPGHVLLAEDGLLDVADELVEGVGEPGDLLLRDAAVVGGLMGVVLLSVCFVERAYAAGGWVGARSAGRPGAVRHRPTGSWCRRVWSRWTPVQVTVTDPLREPEELVASCWARSSVGASRPSRRRAGTNPLTEQLMRPTKLPRS